MTGTNHLIDESSRPRLPKGDLNALSPARRAAGQHLVAIHDHLRRELARLRAAVDRVAAGRDDPAVARSLVNQLATRQNRSALGSFCAGYCHLLTTHHGIEDRYLFGQLRQRQASLGPVLDRLTEEHEVIAGVLTRLDAALVAMLADPAALDEVRGQLDLLAEVLLSHLDYEEDQLVEPLGRLNVPV